jgi:hypothetical protein
LLKIAIGTIVKSYHLFFNQDKTSCNFSIIVAWDKTNVLSNTQILASLKTVISKYNKDGLLLSSRMHQAKLYCRKWVIIPPTTRIHSTP